MRNETEINKAQQYRLMILIEQLQRQGRTEREIDAAVREASSAGGDR